MKPRDISRLMTIVGKAHVQSPVSDRLLRDAGELPIAGRAAAAVSPRSTKQVAQIVRYCYQRDLPMYVRGGGTGLAGGAIPRRESVLICMDRLNRVRSFAPEYWRIEVEAGVTTHAVQQLARGAGLLYPPDPGAASKSQIGGNIATNAGGAHTFKYGVTGHWVTGLEVVTHTGEVLTLGGPSRKDVAPYDLKSLFVGAEGTLGIITAAWLKLQPLPDTVLPIVATFRDAAAGSRAMREIFSTAQLPTAIEMLDSRTLAAAKATYPDRISATAHYMLLMEVEGGKQGAAEQQRRLSRILRPRAIDRYSPTSQRAIAQLWNWRYGIYRILAGEHGGKLSEDIGVPLDRLPEAIAGISRIAQRRRLASCTWGHAGDGNLHPTFLLDWNDPDEQKRARAAVADVFDLALRLGGTITGEHGVGRVKRAWLAKQSGPQSYRVQRQIKQLFDPKGLFNPGVKL